ncbi:MAG: hypothetical protein IJD31_03615 [Lachnospiraceae bacterium]|nr:hypothetical protein [Lachnospiraceae bacterium]
MKSKLPDKYIEIKEIEIVDFKNNLCEKEMSDMKKRVLERMAREKESHNRRNIVVAAMAAMCVVLIPTGVYAAGKLNLFGNILGEAEEAPVAPYVEYSSDVNTNEETAGVADVVDDYRNKVYEASNGTYQIKTDYCMYNEETGAGVIQFTLINQTNDGRQWYEVATVDSYYNDWELGTRNVSELYSGESEGQLTFDVSGLGSTNDRVFLKTTESDANKKVCIMVFNDMARVDFSTADLKLVVKESTYNEDKTDLKWNSILSVDIPMGESLPVLKWMDENGNTEVVLSSFDFMVYGIEDGGQDSSIKYTDGSEYHIENNELKIMNQLYGALTEEGIWDCFCNIIDLNNVEAFYFNGMEYPVSEAVIE